MKRTRLMLTVCTSVALTGCAKQVPVPRPAGTAATPRVGWVVMSGDSGNPDSNFVCQSDPRTECVVPVSRANAPSFAHVYFYYHPAATDTTYRGSIDIGFFGSAGFHQVVPDLIVKANDEELGNQSTVGIVSTRLGTYSLAFAVIATSATGAKREIRDSAPVVVR